MDCASQYIRRERETRGKRIVREERAAVLGPDDAEFLEFTVGMLEERRIEARDFREASIAGHRYIGLDDAHGDERLHRSSQMRAKIRRRIIGKPLSQVLIGVDTTSFGAFEPVCGCKCSSFVLFDALRIVVGLLLRTCHGVRLCSACADSHTVAHAYVQYVVGMLPICEVKRRRR